MRQCFRKDRKIAPAMSRWGPSTEVRSREGMDTSMLCRGPLGLQEIDVGLCTLKLLEVLIYPLDERWSASPPADTVQSSLSGKQNQGQQVEEVLIQVIRKV